uniref:Uncharacterized protein n=1 Tax=Siphoviridae sp. ctiOl67 TaxID=2825622 RepID=A0A8S5QJP4_9CAUD|nr:MAG TPA: hypothetical protein [Siphoviridae sp. ctiOl67]
MTIKITICTFICLTIITRKIIIYNLISPISIIGTCQLITSFL